MMNFAKLWDVRGHSSGSRKLKMILLAWCKVVQSSLKRSFLGKLESGPKWHWTTLNQFRNQSHASWTTRRCVRYTGSSHASKNPWDAIRISLARALCHHGQVIHWRRQRLSHPSLGMWSAMAKPLTPGGRQLQWDQGRKLMVSVFIAKFASWKESSSLGYP